MKQLLSELQKVTSPYCVTIALNTHRTKPDYQKDVLTLKKLLKEAYTLLDKTVDPHTASGIIKNLRLIEESINPSIHLDSLVLFASEHFMRSVRLPVKVQERVIVSQKFSLRDVLRAQQQEKNYYILYLNRDSAYLFKAKNDRITDENLTGFPIQNELFIEDRLKSSMSDSLDKIHEEFFNRVDKQLQPLLKESPLPVIVASEARNYDYLLKVADQKDSYAGNVNHDKTINEIHLLADECWKIILKNQEEKINKHKERLKQAVSSGLLFQDLTDIWKALLEGKGAVLYLSEHYSPYGYIKNNIVHLDSDIGYTTDIIDLLIHKALETNCDIRLLSNGFLEKFGNTVLITRY